MPEQIDYWARPEVVSLIQEHQAYLLVNIGSAVGDDKVTPEQFISGYEDAVKRIREAGIHTSFVIDSPDRGKDLEILNATAAELIQADPVKNLVFSMHQYWSKSSGINDEVIQFRLKASAALGYPRIVGSFQDTAAMQAVTNRAIPAASAGYS